MSIKDDFTGAFRQRDNALAQLILINLVAWVLYVTVLVIFNSQSGVDNIRLAVEMPSDFSLFITRPWTIITYSFLHDHQSLFHILSNMLWLYIFGRLLKEYLGSDKLISIYILGSIFGGVAFFLMYNIIPAFSNHVGLLVGASASVTAIVVATATLLPDYRINLMFLGPVKITYIALFMVVTSYLGTLRGTSYGSNAGGDMSHLGGAAIGYFYIILLRKGTDIGKWVTNFRVWFMGLFKPKPKVKVSYKSKEKKKPSAGAQPGDVSQAEIDIILDKISQSGYESLTKEEKQKLFNASKK